MRLTTFANTDWDSHLISQPIRWFTDSDRSHSGIHARGIAPVWLCERLGVRGGSLVDVTFEARVKVGFHPWSDYQKPNIDVDEWEIRGVPGPKQMAAFRAIVEEWDGRLYAFGQLFGLANVYLAKKLGIAKRLTLRKATVCSELVWRFVYSMGGRIGARLYEEYHDRDLFTPSNQRDHCNAWKADYKRVRVT